MSGGESFAAQRTDRVRMLQRFRLATSPLYQNQRDRRRPQPQETAKALIAEATIIIEHLGLHYPGPVLLTPTIRRLR